MANTQKKVGVLGIEHRGICGGEGKYTEGRGARY